jgi:myosin heavy subunit
MQVTAKSNRASNMRLPPSLFWYLLTTAIAEVIAQVRSQVQGLGSRPSPMMNYKDDSASRKEEAMVRKRTSQPLQDLQPPASPQEPTAVTVETSAVAVEETAAEDTAAEDTTAKPAEPAAPPPAIEPATKPSPAELALKAEIAQLQTALETERQTAQQQQASLQQTISALQTALQSQQEQVRSLQAEVQQMQPLKAQLEETKTTLLQLSEVNSQLQSQLQDQLQAKSQPIAQPTQAQSAKPLAISSPPSTMQRVQTPEPGLDSASARVQASQGIVPMAGRDLPRSQGLARRPNSRPVMPTVLPPMSAEQKPVEKGKPPEMDTGWMD